MTPLPTRLAVALLHHPIYNRKHEVVTTAITNIDLHDIARTARTYASEAFYVVTPVDAQIKMAQSIVEHWRGDWATAIDHPRAESMSRLQVLPSLEAATADFSSRIQGTPVVVATSAAHHPKTIPFATLRSRIWDKDLPGILITFGTGWGMPQALVESMDLCLEPIAGIDGFNHLPVRAAVAIVLDRLFGPR